MGNTESSNQAFENAFDPNKNGAADAFDPNKNGFIPNMTDFGGGFITGLEIVGTSALGMLGGGGGLFGGGGGTGSSGGSANNGTLIQVLIICNQWYILKQGPQPHQQQQRHYLQIHLQVYPKTPNNY